MTRAAVLLLASALAACAPHKPAVVAAPASTQFATFVDEVFERRFAFRPTAATSVGLHEYDERFEDWSAASFSARVKELKDELDALARIPRASLGFDDQIDADALDGLLHAELYDIDEQQEWRRNPMWYAALPGRSLHGLMKRDYAPKAQRVAAMTKRLERLPAHWAAARLNLVDPPRVFTEISVRGAKGLVKFLEGPVKAWAGDATPAFAKAHAQAVEGAKAFVEFLEKDLLPRSHGEFAIGETRFLHKLKWDERLEVGLGELLARGEAQLAKDHAAFVETAKEIDPKKPAGEVFKDMESEHPQEDQLLGAVSASLEEVRRFLVDKDLVTLPSEVRPGVEATPPFARAQASPSWTRPARSRPTRPRRTTT